MPDRTDRLTERLPFKKGALCGACAYLLGYLVTYAVTVERVRSELSRMQVDATLSLFGSGGIAPWQITGWYFYGAHFVDISVTSSAMDLSVETLEASTSNPRVLLFALPPLLLVIAGLLAAHLASARGWAVAVAAGLTVVPGYFVLAFVGAFLTQVSIVIAAVGPELTHALAAGFVYPLVFGPLGGVLAATIQRSRASSSPHGSNP
jgi:uncharacterized protein (DUF2062 family)